MNSLYSERALNVLFLRKKTGMEFFIHTRKCIPDEKNEIKDRAEKGGVSVSSYARSLLFLEDNTKDIQDNTVVIQEKDERISDLKNQIDDYKKQIEQLHTIILATQKDNQLLIELKTKKWWQFWK